MGEVDVTSIYVIAEMVEGEMEQRKAILDALICNDWFSGELGALATMDQWNQYRLEQLAQVQYDRGEFYLLGTFKMDLAGLV